MKRNHTMKYVWNDLFAGLIVAAMSIPISIGYTQVAGLPAIYGLYGSVFPILIFALISTSPQMVFGVDAAPAALVGGVIASLGIEANSAQAMTFIPLLTFFTACWLFLFYVVKAGRVVNYISTPVMGGFISGIACTIILMQVPKLMGGTSGSGELFELLEHIFHSAAHIHILSLVLGIVTLVIILVSKRFAPKFPMAIVMMVVGAVLTKTCNLEAKGVTMLSKVESGLPHFEIPDFSIIDFKDGMALSLTIALVIMAETLLASNNFATKNGYKINDNRELLAYSLANFGAAFTGCIPMNGSVSRTVIGEQFGSKTRLMSVFAGFAMIGVLLFGTGFIGYLPVPVLTAIIMSALLGVIEGDLAVKLWKVNRAEFLIFMAAFGGVLVLGTIYGVIIGCVLSFIAVIIRAVEPPTGFLGVIPGQEGFYDLERNKNARKIRNTVIYRFGGNLFFANIKKFQEDIEKAITEETNQVIIDASAIGNIDISAAERLEILEKGLREKGIYFYITGQMGTVNDQLRTLGIGHLVEEGVVRRTITLALRDAGVHKPYPIEEEENSIEEQNYIESSDAFSEFEWAFGTDAAERMERYTKEYIEHIKPNDKEALKDIREWEENSKFGRLGLFDEDEFLKRLEMHLSELSSITGYDEVTIEELIEQRRQRNEQKLKQLNKQTSSLLKEHRHRLAEHLKQRHPDAFAHLLEKRAEHIKRLEKTDPEAAARWREWYDMDL
ncbi:sulfate permease [Lachnospiraceae bacterium KM106-2]|nr:sulfate permease [Lachnospiraceae bacterium KM106-2]